MKAFAAPRTGAGIESCEMIEVAEPTCKSGQVRVKVHAGALNSADVKVLEGMAGAGFIHGKTSPHIVGYDFSGVVESVGPSVGDLAVGDAVFGFLPYSPGTKNGSFAELVTTSAAELSKKPDDVAHVDAAAIATVGATALQVFRDKARLQSGQRVLVHGASGGVGAYAVQIAKALGATVVGTASAAKLDFVKGLGADEVVDYRATPLTEIAGPFDAILDAACASSYGVCKNILGPRGAYVTLLPSGAFIAGKLATIFSGRSCDFLPVKAVPKDFEQLARWLQSGAIRSPVEETFALDKTGDALRLMQSGKVKGKVAVTIADG